MAVTKRSIARDAVAVATGLHLADLAAVRGVRAARRHLVRDDNSRRLGVTPRYVHLLLEAAGRSFSGHVLDIASPMRAGCCVIRSGAP